MKRILSIFLTLCICTAMFFADEPGDEYDDGFVYQQNGAGDQFLKIELDGFFPLNFGETLYPGFGATIGYYKFLTSMFGVGGELSVTNNFSIGGKALFMIPITFGGFFQPTLGKFEFPIHVNVGLSTETWANMTYWPALTVKASLGAFYRVSESWSFGLSGTILSISEFANSDKQKRKSGLFAVAGINARFHF